MREARESTEAEKKWNGYCDVLAIAIAREYDLPVMGAFELLRDGRLGFLVHAFCLLPEGRMVDCNGVSPAIRPDECDSGPDPDVVGFTVVETGEHDPHMLSLARHDYDLEIENLDARGFIAETLAPHLRSLGLVPVSPFRPASP